MSLDFLKKWAVTLFDDAVRVNHDNIISLLEKNVDARFLDLGCSGGIVTVTIAAALGTKEIYGIEIMEDQIKIAESRGIKVLKSDLNSKIAFEDNYFDVIHANQIIEHLYNTDNFISEIFRVLKPGGYAVVSTENASSWVNVVSSLLGFQIFSLTNFSMKRWAIGNPLSVHIGETPTGADRHVRIYNYLGLLEYFKAFGFHVDKVMGAGYYPLPTSLGNIDKIHAHFLALKVFKPKKFIN